MGRKKVWPPRIYHHKLSGRARVCIDGTFVSLGPYGSEEAMRAYQEIVSRYEKDKTIARSPYMVGELAVRFLEHAATYYSEEGKERQSYAYALKPLTDMYDDLAVSDFGPLKLKAVRMHMVEAGLSRGVINQRIERIRRVFKWGVSEEIVTPSVYDALCSVQRLRKNTTGVTETERGKLPTRGDLEKILPHCSKTVRAMLEVQWITGMRCKELRKMQWCEIERESEECWIYRPGSHKTDWRGKTRFVVLGPKSIAILQELFKNCTLEHYVFRPSVGRASRYPNDKLKPVDPAHDYYEDSSYSRAVERACLKAGVSFHPYLLRHEAKQRIKRDMGLDAARAQLGHSSVSTTEHYGEIDLEIAKRVAKEMG